MGAVAVARADTGAGAAGAGAVTRARVGEGTVAGGEAATVAAVTNPCVYLSWVV